MTEPKKTGLTLLRKRSSLRILRRAGITCCRVQKVSTQNLWEVCVHKPFSSLAHSILFGCAEGHSDPPEMFRHRLATSRWRGQCAVGIEPCYAPSYHQDELITAESRPVEIGCCQPPHCGASGGPGGGPFIVDCRLLINTI